uniref:Uncharacterized protein n=1 Tax=Pristionchus pacificus TaxID=54126 RepID=A0A2A6B5Y5_PRIPA|eukprot:PDM61287.1 hypothetical protein PRIPAC_50729 [Pristionchus pacificus]
MTEREGRNEGRTEVERRPEIGLESRAHILSLDSPLTRSRRLIESDPSLAQIERAKSIEPRGFIPANWDKPVPELCEAHTHANFIAYNNGMHDEQCEGRSSLLTG